MRFIPFKPYVGPLISDQVKNISEKYELLISENKVIELEMNPKETELIEKLNKGFYILNTWDIRGPDGRSVHTQLIYLHIIQKSRCQSE
jgi:hypothetical protein